MLIPQELQLSPFSLFVVMFKYASRHHPFGRQFYKRFNKMNQTFCITSYTEEVQ